MVEQRRLPDPRLAAHHEHAASSSARSLKQPIEHSALVSAIQQHQLPRSRTTVSHGRRDLRGKPFRDE